MTGQPRSLKARPIAPTSSLPPLARLSSYPLVQITDALTNLRNLYFPPPDPPVIPIKHKLPKHLIHDISVPDSGYASAEEEDDDDCKSIGGVTVIEGEGDDFDIDILRSDTFEREFAIRWLTGFTARSDTWIYVSEEEEDARSKAVDDSASLLSLFAGEDEEEALTRAFSFQLHRGEGMTGHVEVELNDAPLLSEDHTSVGLQSWASSIFLAERMCADPAAFRLVQGASNKDGRLRVLELGAGTGLLSIVAAKLLVSSSCPPQIIATDYHPSVLDNLEANITTNFHSTRSTSSPIQVLPLDWQNPVYDPPLDESFDVILAADVIYHPEHAQWIKRCVERLLVRPTQIDDSNEKDTGGVFWLMIPIRSTGRHEGMDSTIEAVFPAASSIGMRSFVKASTAELAILSMESISRHEGVGRADESAYRLFEIGWIFANGGP